jgi:hypothetical protein
MIGQSSEVHAVVYESHSYVNASNIELTTIDVWQALIGLPMIALLS